MAGATSAIVVDHRQRSAPHQGTQKGERFPVLRAITVASHSASKRRLFLKKWRKTNANRDPKQMRASSMHVSCQRRAVLQPGLCGIGAARSEFRAMRLLSPGMCECQGGL